MKSILLLGSTGSVGENTLQIVADRPEAFRVTGLVAGRQFERLVEQCRRFRPIAAAVADPEAGHALAQALAGVCRTYAGSEGVLRLVRETPCDVAVQAITGAAGLPSTLALVDRGARVALANKESLVAAGHLLVPLSRKRGAEILPVDSEHSAIFQCLRGERLAEVRRVFLTGSGGPFRERPLESFDSITPAEALRHPNWSMGERITLDSATMMNKAFEVIEAHHLFSLEPEQIEVLLHPQSLVHSMVEFRDGSILAQLGLPDMKIPIHYALTHPDRAPNGYPAFDPTRFGTLTFAPADPVRYPAIELGYRCVREGGLSGAVLNAADEVAISRFLAGDLRFPAIVECAREVLEARPRGFGEGTEAVFAADAWAREAAARWTA